MKKLPQIKSQKIKKIFTTKAKVRRWTRMSNHENDKKGANSAWKDVGWFALKTAAISGVVLGGTAIALPAIGFTAGGVAAGSLAASFQSAFLGGTIASGSTFAILQSVGAAGLAASTKAAVVAVSATAAGAHSALKKAKKIKETNPQNATKESSDSDMVEDVDEEEMANNDDKEALSEIKNDSLGLDSSQNTGTVKDKSYSMKFVKSNRSDECMGDSVALKNEKHKNEYDGEMDSLRVKWEDVELGQDLSITHQLIKKGKLRLK